MYRVLFILALVLMAGAVSANPVEGSGAVNAADFGVKADGKTPCSAALQKAIDSFPGAAGGVVKLPAGIMVLDNTVTVKENVELVGSGESWENTASVFHVRFKTGPAFQLAAYCGVKGVSVEYPDNLSDEKMRKPDVYPPAFELTSCNVNLEYINFDGAYTGVASHGDGSNSGQCLFSCINGFCHHRGFWLSGAADINRFENIHFFPSRSNQYTEKDAYYMHNLIAFDFGRQDGAMFTNCFIICGRGFFRQAVDSPGPGSSAGIPVLPYNASLGYVFNGCWIEQVDFGFDLGGVLGFTISDCNILVNKGGTGVLIRPEAIAYNGSVSGTQIRGFGGDNCFVGIDYDMALKYWGKTQLNKLTIADCQIQGASPAIHLGSRAQRVWIKGCLLNGWGNSPAVVVDKGAEYVYIKDNIFQTDGKSPVKPLKAFGNKGLVIGDNHTEDVSQQKPKQEAETK